MNIRYSDLKVMCDGKWPMILADLAPSIKPAIDHAPVPVKIDLNGGTTEFRMFDDFHKTGGSVENPNVFNSNGFSTLMHVNHYSFDQALEEVKEWFAKHEGKSGNNTPVKTKPSKPKTKVDPDRQKAKQEKIWKDCIPLSDPDAEPAAKYLNQRGLDMDDWPNAMKFHKAMDYYTYEEGKPKKVGSWPCIVSCLQDDTGKASNLHRIYLTPEGNKAPVDDAKKLMQSTSPRRATGSAIRLGKPDRILAFSEGIETGLAVMQATGIPTWATVSAAMMPSVWIPESVEEIHIFTDLDPIKDPTNRKKYGAGLEAAAALAHNASINGKRVFIHIPTGPLVMVKDKEKGIDWLDILNSIGSEAFPNIGG